VRAFFEHRYYDVIWQTSSQKVIYSGEARAGAMVKANSFNNFVGILSGPEALWGSSPDKKSINALWINMNWLDRWARGYIKLVLVFECMPFILFVNEFLENHPYGCT